MATLQDVCPYCNHPKPSPGKSAAMSPEERIGYIHNEVRRLEDLITKLYQERSALLQQLNEIQSPISILPPETLSVVFQHACPPPPCFHERPSYAVPDFVPPKQFVLGAVSTHWRRTLLSTPSLWASVDLEVLSHTRDRVSNILQAFFARSGNLPISIGLHYFSPAAHHHVREPEYLVDPSVDPILYENARRIRGLHLFRAHSPWINYISQLSNLSDLTLSIQSALNRTPTDLSFEDVPCSRINISSCRARIQLSWEAVTVLHLSQVPITVCLELLERCTNLVEFRIKSPISAPAPGVAFPPPRQPFVLPHLKIFEWPVHPHRPSDNTMLRLVHMPALQQLVWVASEPVNWITPEFAQAFFDRLPATLSTLEVEDAEAQENSVSVFDVIRDGLGVEHLVLSRCSYTFVTRVLWKLGTAPSAQNGNERGMVLPELKSMVFMGLDLLSTSGQELLLRMLEYRFQHGMTSLRLEFALCRLRWLPEFREKMRDFVGRGLKVEVIGEAGSMNWL